MAAKCKLTGIAHLLPTPEAKNGNGGGRYNSEGHQSTLPGEVRLLSTPQARDYKGVPADGFNAFNLCRDVADVTNWGKYEPAIRRWEMLTRPAPEPTEPNTKGNPRLAAEFSEWLMGWPDGWVTQVLGVSRNDALRIIGNGVCIQQAVAALQFLLSIEEAI